LPLSQLSSKMPRLLYQGLLGLDLPLLVILYYHS
jgi:hypothetical protein